MTQEFDNPTPADTALQQRLRRQFQDGGPDLGGGRPVQAPDDQDRRGSRRCPGGFHGVGQTGPGPGLHQPGGFPHPGWP